MSIPTTPVDLPVNQERADAFSFFQVADEIFPTRWGNVKWDSRLPYGIYDAGHMLSPVNNYDAIPSITGDVLTPVLLDRLALADRIDVASMFRYELREEAPALEVSSAVLAAENTKRIERARPIVFARALAVRLDAYATEAYAGRQATVADAIAIIDDALVNRGIYGGVIHVPGYLASRMKASIGSNLRTHSGTRIHLMPSVTLEQPEQIYGTGNVFYAERTLNDSFVGTDDGTERPTEKNTSWAQGWVEGIVAFDEVALSIATDDITSITTAVV